MTSSINWRDYAQTQTEKFYKATLWQGEHVMLGINCFAPHQSQPVHAHEHADKFYLVLEGRGTFVIGEEKQEVGEGIVVVAPAGVAHGVTNNEEKRLTLLVGIAPPIR
jgi:mannose-6-phosphate isomerase-like protein (cupin superfamily)